MVEADAVRQRCSVVSERKSVDSVEELKREKGFRLRVRDGMPGRRRPRSRLDRIMLSKRVIAACVGVMFEAVVDPGAGAVLSRSAMNSLKALHMLACEVREE